VEPGSGQCLNPHKLKMNKGFVLTLDAAVAAFLVLTILAYANYLVNESEVTQWSEYNMLSTGYDVATMLCHTGAFQTLNASLIENSLQQALPANYAMRIQVDSYQNIGGVLYPQTQIVIGPEIADSALKTHGKRTFLTFTGNNAGTYNLVEFWIWLK